MGAVLLILSTKACKKGGRGVEIMILLLLKTLSDRGTIIAREIPSKMVEKTIQTIAMTNRPL
jgi:hypothetical protein